MAADGCLVDERSQAGADEKTAADTLYRSLNSPPEQLLMLTYCARYAKDGGFDLPR
jgi:hypothetical protein